MNSYTINDTVINISELSIRFDSPMLYVNETLRNYIHNIKLEIEPIIVAWEKNKKYSNPYEFINMSYDSNTSPVCNYKPISRAFFKMIEILNNFNFSFNKDIESFHLAEGPGGFIEALQFLRQNPNDKYYGMTLMVGDKDVPKWDKYNYYLNKNPNINIEKGA